MRFIDLLCETVFFGHKWRGTAQFWSLRFARQMYKNISQPGPACQEPDAQAATNRDSKFFSAVLNNKTFQA